MKSCYLKTANFTGGQRGGAAERWQGAWPPLRTATAQICEIPRNSERIRPHGRSGSYNVIDLGIESTLCNFLLRAWASIGTKIADVGLPWTAI